MEGLEIYMIQDNNKLVSKHFLPINAQCEK